MSEGTVRLFYRLGAVFYVLWGILHIYAAWIGFELAASEAPGMVQAKLQQNAWNLGYIAIFSIVIAVLFNWRNSLTGYFLNGFTVSAADIGFVIFIMLPGLSRDILGPALWLLGLACTTVGIVGGRKAA